LRFDTIYYFFTIQGSLSVSLHLPSVTVKGGFDPTKNTSLCGCDKCLKEYDPWFSELMNASPEPFLAMKSNISQDTFTWWKGIQFEKRSFSYYNTTVERIFQVFPPSPDFAESSPDHCRTCAVVGNFGNLNGSRYGPLIDFHDIVIRMNHGRTKGFEKDVGTKTTHHVMYPQSSTNLDNTTHLVLFPFKISDLQWLLKSLTQGLTLPPQQVVILSPAFMKYVHFVWLKNKGHYPSTGFLTLILSMHMCDEVSVFGFGADRAGNWNHYYEILKNQRLRTGNHHGNLEYELIQELYQRQKISFFRGW
uniref:ST3 beta-galactoside alpha-2,3-sialyltransferase 1 n=1 Tax=Lates calcarifer TaxID=8187 RepID=A0A4W6DNV8_LATCA